MSAIFGGGPKPPPVTPVAPPPQVDDAMSRINERDKQSRRQGRRSTILTSDEGLPDLGSTTTPGM